MLKKNNFKICVLGLGYVGFPLYQELSKKFDVVGYDVNKNRVRELLRGTDKTGEFSKSNINKKKLKLYSLEKEVPPSNVYIVTVPTPIDNEKNPDLRFLKKASLFISKRLNRKDLVIYESTTYPGCTRNFCVPILEKSGLKSIEDFGFGYSPERINPSSKVNKLSNTIKVISASDKNSLKKVKTIYGKIIHAGLYEAETIEVAEASKLVENCQRDINIAFMNELSVIFNKLNIDTSEVLKASSTKWNFLPFKPGLVGGHCISVDPYYLSYIASETGRRSKIINLSRHVNEDLSNTIIDSLNSLSESKLQRKLKSVLILGASFKENCPDTRNSKVFDIYRILKSKKVNVKIIDPIAVNSENKSIPISKNIRGLQGIDAIILAVPHSQIINKYKKKIIEFHKNGGIVFDIKSVLKKENSDGRL